MVQGKGKLLAAVKAIGRELTVRELGGEYRVSIAIPAIQMVNDCDYSTARERNEAIAVYCDASDVIASALHVHEYFVNYSSKGI